MDSGYRLLDRLLPFRCFIMMIPILQCHQEVVNPKSRSLDVTCLAIAGQHLSTMASPDLVISTRSILGGLVKGSFAKMFCYCPHIIHVLSMVRNVYVQVVAPRLFSSLRFIRLV